MWTTRHSVHTDVSAAAVWATVRAVHLGTLSLPGGDVFVAHGPFELGTELSITPAGQDTFRARIVELIEAERYADETRVGELALTFRYLLARTGDGGTALTHELVIDGPAADREGPGLGAQISADFPDQLDRLIAAARAWRG